MNRCLSFYINKRYLYVESRVRNESNLQLHIPMFLYVSGYLVWCNGRLQRSTIDNVKEVRLILEDNHIYIAINIKSSYVLVLRLVKVSLHRYKDL